MYKRQAFLHMLRVFYHRAYRPPRQFNWVVGIVLLIVTLFLSYTGYLLPWDQLAFWGVSVLSLIHISGSTQNAPSFRNGRNLVHVDEVLATGNAERHL